MVLNHAHLFLLRFGLCGFFKRETPSWWPCLAWVVACSVSLNHFISCVFLTTLMEYYKAANRMKKQAQLTNPHRKAPHSRQTRWRPASRRGSLCLCRRQHPRYPPPLPPPPRLQRHWAPREAAAVAPFGASEYHCLPAKHSPSAASGSGRPEGLVPRLDASHQNRRATYRRSARSQGLILAFHS